MVNQYPSANWRLLDFTNKLCKVTPFFDSYEPVKEVMGTVWTSPNTGHEYLLVGDQMLWFGSQMDHSLINQIKSMSMAYPCTITLSLNHSLVSTAMMTSFPSIPWGQLCILSTIVYFESRVPTDWEMHNLPIIMLTGEAWDPVNVGCGNGHSREQAEMRTIQSLEIGVTKRKMAVT